MAIEIMKKAHVRKTENIYSNVRLHVINTPVYKHS